jgi:IMP dehydrogenase
LTSAVAWGTGSCVSPSLRPQWIQSLRIKWQSPCIGLGAWQSFTDTTQSANRSAMAAKKSHKCQIGQDRWQRPVGVTGDFMERSEALIATGVDVLCIDVAHGHHALVKKALEQLRNEYDNHIYIIAGNVCTLEGINDVADWGADAVRCNIGGGSICSTRIVTGHGLPGLQTIFDCARTDREVAIIADGGIKTSGDIVKALAAGADFVMCGSLLAGTTESPGNIISLPDKAKVKEYRGMASKDAQLDWRNKSSTPEGVASYIPFKGSVLDILRDLEGGIKSGFSYSGARNLTELQSKVEWARQTLAGTRESGTHIFNQSGKRK